MASVFKFLLALQLLLARPASIKWILLITRNFHSCLASWRAVVSHTGPLRSWLYNSWIYNYLCDLSLSSLTLWVRIPLRRGVLETTLCDKVCQWLVTGLWFSPGTPFPLPIKTDCHDISEILLKVVLKTITHTLSSVLMTILFIKANLIFLLVLMLTGLERF